MPFVAQVAVGRRERLSVFGADYETADGTGERDYIHVVDLAKAHLAAVEFLEAQSGCEAFNIGTGSATSVLQIVRAFEAASGQNIPFQIVGRRPGDIGTSVAGVAKATDKLNWHAEHSLEDICGSCWDWQSKNPNGYQAQT
jgi:UDP-glucose 4-epimerase